MPVIIHSARRNGVPVTEIGYCGTFSVRKTFDCGQAFRFDPAAEDIRRTFFPDEPDTYAVWGTAFGKNVLFAEHSGRPGVLTVVNADVGDCLSLWIPYLSLDTDYGAIDRFLSDALPSPEYRAVMKNAVRLGQGIRILRQDPFETVISFIISQNNNIPRIKKIIAALCRKLGEETAVPGTYAFPTPDAVCRAGLDGLAPIRAGFRGKYILDAAEKFRSGEVDPRAVRACSDYGEALALLRKIKGVGPKVGACALLFGFGRTEAFPVDVWMQKSLARHFPEGIDISAFGAYAGIAQQYLFYSERYLGGDV